MGSNVENIRCAGIRIIRGKIPRQVRNELMTAVKNKELGRLKKDGLMPEVFYHPDQLHTAIEMQKNESDYKIQCIKKVIQ